MTLLEELIQTAKEQIGVCEEPLGSNNTIYGERYGWNGVAWCCIFSWCICDITNERLGLTDKGIQFPKAAHCNQVEAFAKEQKRWITPDMGFKVGDFVIFDYNKDTERDHIEFVIQTGAGYVRTIGGNVSDKVCELNRFLDSSGIIGAYRPDYGEEADVPTSTDDAGKAEEYCTATVPMIQHGSIGLEVELMQYALCRNGYLPENSRKQNGFFDGEFGLGTEAALENFQEDNNISPCELGKLGPETIQALLGE